MIGSIRMPDGLFYFDNNFLKGGQAQVASSSVISIPVEDEIMVWHNRLGHPCFSYLKQLFPTLFKNLNPLIFQCEVCQVSKHHHVHFSSHHYQESQPFYLIHNDVWGPSRHLCVQNPYISNYIHRKRSNLIYATKE